MVVQGASTYNKHLVKLSTICTDDKKAYTKSSVPDELSDNTESTRDTEEDGVVVLLVKTVAAGLAQVSARIYIST